MITRALARDLQIDPRLGALAVETEEKVRVAREGDLPPGRIALRMHDYYWYAPEPPCRCDTHPGHCRS